jgi:hypothetical protein
MYIRTALLGIVFFAIGSNLSAQERFSFFQASTPESVERLLKLAQLKDNDVVVDLGSGNGLIVLTAAKMNANLRGRGVDIDPKLVNESNDEAKRQGVANRVKFVHENAFDAELKDATVITMWLFPEFMRLLRPTILERARPGTRVLTSTWDLGSWPADAVDSGSPTIHMWIVPARIAGNWNWQFTLRGQRVNYAAVADQNFQSAEGVLRAGRHREVLQDVRLRGEDISFNVALTIDGLGLTRHEFRGKVHGDKIEGTAKVALASGENLELPWQATRSAKSDYFAPTGTDFDFR